MCRLCGVELWPGGVCPRCEEAMDRITDHMDSLGATMATIEIGDGGGWTFQVTHPHGGSVELPEDYRCEVDSNVPDVVLHASPVTSCCGAGMGGEDWLRCLGCGRGTFRLVRP